MNDMGMQIQSIVDHALSTDRPVHVLEAGCGSFSHLLRRPNWHISGIDISYKQLERNTYLNEKILGDIQTFPLQPSSYDMIVNWWVLEHLPRPNDALKRFAKALKPGGILVLAFPNVFSIKGLVTKFAPHWFHVWIYRRILNRPNAGRDDREPFPTFLRFSIAPRRLIKFAGEHGLGVAFFDTYEAGYQIKLRENFAVMRVIWCLIRQTILAISFGTVDPNQTECVIVLKKCNMESECPLET